MHNINTLVKILINECITKNSICIDATAGNGNDTLFLCQKAKFVYAFDIQKQSEINTLKRLIAYDNYEFILDNHTNITKYISTNIDIAMFNLGYLPYSDTKTTTHASSSISAIDQCFNLLKTNGMITICCYQMHVGGLDETNKIINHVIINYQKFQIMQTKINGPILIVIRK